jgi:hypothetical protein
VNTNPWILAAALASAAAAWFALVITLINSSTSRRALRLAEAQDERRNRQLEIYLADAVGFHGEDESARTIAFCLTITNTSDSPNAIVAADLCVTYRLENGVLTRVKLPSMTPAHLTIPGYGAVCNLAIPLPFDARGAQSGWIIFQLHRDLTGESSIEGYEVLLRDSYRAEESVTVLTVREILHD